jgi:hypothetical protein
MENWEGVEENKKQLNDPKMKQRNPKKVCENFTKGEKFGQSQIRGMWLFLFYPILAF